MVQALSEIKAKIVCRDDLPAVISIDVTGESVLM